MKIFFFHLPKAAGTAIHSVFSQLYSAGDISPIIENNITDHQRRNGTYRKFRGYRFYSGHYGADVFDAVAEGHVCIANFREPVERVYSLYRYFRELVLPEKDLDKAKYSVVRKSKQLSLLEFCSSCDEDILTYTCNWQARQLTRSPWSYFNDVEIDRAFKMIDQMKWFYVCEEPERSLWWLAHEFGIRMMPIVNITPKKRDLRELAQARHLIMERNRMDIELYAYAKSRLADDARSCAHSSMASDDHLA